MAGDLQWLHLLKLGTFFIIFVVVGVFIITWMFKKGHEVWLYLILIGIPTAAATLFFVDKKKFAYFMAAVLFYPMQFIHWILR